MSQIQGKDVTLRFYLNGQVVRGIPVKKFTWEADDEIRQRDLLGEPRNSKQHLIHGYKGTFEMDLENFRHHEIVEFLNNSDKSGVPNYEIAFQIKENYRDGSSKRYRFVRCVTRIPKTDSGDRKSDSSATWEWEAEDIVYLN